MRDRAEFLNSGNREHSTGLPSSGLKADYSFPFTGDSRFIHRLDKEALLRLAGPENTIPHAEALIAELEIKDRIAITRLIPSADEQWRITPKTGIAIRTPSPKSVELLFDPDNPNTVGSLSRWSGRQIAHELSHVARMEAYPLHTTLVDALVSEGMGVYLEENLNGQFQESHWGHTLPADQLRTEWDKAQAELFSSDFDYAEWFYGVRNKHALYTGYSLGNAIVREFFSLNRGLAIAEAVRRPSTGVLEQSQFKP